VEQDILFPYRTTPRRIAEDVIAALDGCPAVGRVLLFGSLADDTYDAWSDIDIVCEVEDEGGAWAAAAALREALPVRWHGPFGSATPPRGRHWFEGESLFHSLDLSFETASRLEEIAREGLNGVPVRFREVAAGRPQRVAMLPPPARVSDEYEFTHALHLLLRGIRAYLRGGGGWSDVSARMPDLEAALKGLPRRPAGGDARAVAQEARTLYTTLLMERARYGGEP
jgi:predicted nucleotidyltransferase